jgi:hypothetical protein
MYSGERKKVADGAKYSALRQYEEPARDWQEAGGNDLDFSTIALGGRTIPESPDLRLRICLCTKGAQQTSPGQSAAPPWVTGGHPHQALKGRNTVCLLRPFRASAIIACKPQVGAALWAGLLRTLGAKTNAQPKYLRFRLA